jgi:hypothetical protein
LTKISYEGVAQAVQLIVTGDTVNINYYPKLEREGEES